MAQFTEFVTNHPILFLALGTIIILLIWSLLGDRLGGFESVSPAQAIQLINHKNGVVLDIRGEESFAKGHIVHALHIAQDKLDKRMKHLEKYREKPIIVSCDTGQQSARVCARLHKAGFSAVYNLKGGLVAWQGANLPVRKK